MPNSFNNRLRQLILLSLIILLAILLMRQLAVFLPGFLGAITLYILLRGTYFNLTIKKRWSPGLTALLFIFASLVLIAIPVYFSIWLISSKVSMVLQNTGQIEAKALLIGSKIQEATGYQLMSADTIRTAQQQLSGIIPGILNSSASIISNFLIMFFLLFFLLKSGRAMEQFLSRFIPLKEENIDLLSHETKNMIRANAIGIPILALLQGIIATIGYALFGVDDYLLWGFLTGVCSLIPVVGTAIIWIPLVAWFWATGDHTAGIGLGIYALVLITNVDYVARLTILRKLMDVHPLITIFGVITGVGLFGFWGVIFGPLMISYFIILVRIYINEFGKPVSESI